MQRHDEEATEHKDAQREDDIQANFDDHTVDHCRHGIRREAQREMHDASHQLGYEVQALLQFLPFFCG